MTLTQPLANHRGNALDRHRQNALDKVTNGPKRRRNNDGQKQHFNGGERVHKCQRQECQRQNILSEMKGAKRICEHFFQKRSRRQNQPF